MRSDGRQPNKVRPIKITRNFIKYAEGSVLIEAGLTKIICTASVEDRVPPHLQGSGTGWITAEYSMIPRAGQERSARNKLSSGGRSMEIRRLIGRSLRSITDLSLLGEKTIVLDCDVIQADGGTRTTSINGSFIALVDALRSLLRTEKISGWPIKDYVSAISVGKVDDHILLDLCYEEDVRADVDLNVVMTAAHQFVEIQGTGEEATFSYEDLDKMLKCADKGIREVIEIQKKIVGKLGQ